MDKSWFDVLTDRSKASHTYSTKYNGMADRYADYNTENALPLWIADTDFRCPPEVIEAVKTRAEHGIYGYTSPDLVYGEYMAAAAGWMKRRYGWDAKAEWGVYTPGVVNAVVTAIQEFTKPGDGIIIQPPVYYPFAEGIRNNDRVVKNNCLIEKEPGYYEMDFVGLEDLASDPNTTMMILCNPHNPTGRVWKEEELRKVCEICLKHDVLIFSDEIHADLMMPGSHHIAVGSLGEEIANHLIAGYAASKTFNLAGLCTSAIMIPNPELRQRMLRRAEINRLPKSNVFGPLAGKVAYESCDEYVDAQMEYVSANVDYVIEFCKENLPKISLRKPEGTYLVWMDFRKLGMDVDQLHRFVTEEAGVVGDFGVWFGPGGEGYIRFNLACPRATVEQMMEKLKAACDRKHI